MKRPPEYEDSSRYEYPERLVKLQQELGARVATYVDLVDKTGTYDDTIGHSPYTLALDEEGPFAQFIDRFDIKQRDIQQGFEQFNLSLLNSDSIRRMALADRRTLADHFIYYIERVANQGRVLRTPGVDLEDRFAEYGFESEASAHNYGEVLRVFVETIKHQPFFGDLWHEANRRGKRTLEQVVEKRNADVRKHNQRVPYVIYDTRDDKLRIQFEEALEPAFEKAA